MLSSVLFLSVCNLRLWLLLLSLLSSTTAGKSFSLIVDLRLFYLPGAILITIAIEENYYYAHDSHKQLFSQNSLQRTYAYKCLYNIHYTHLHDCICVCIYYVCMHVCMQVCKNYV